MRKAAQDAKEKYQEEINKQINEIQPVSGITQYENPSAGSGHKALVVM